MVRAIKNRGGLGQPGHGFGMARIGGQPPGELALVVPIESVFPTDDPIGGDLVDKRVVTGRLVGFPAMSCLHGRINRRRRNASQRRSPRAACTWTVCSDKPSRSAISFWGTFCNRRRMNI